MGPSKLTEVCLAKNKTATNRDGVYNYFDFRGISS